MAVDRVRLAGALAEIAAGSPEIEDFPERLCAACVDALPVDGVGLSLITRDQPDGRTLLGASDVTGAQIEELQFTLGEGPCVSAFTDARPVLVPDLQDTEPRLRWPMFTREAEAVGVGALFAFPLQVGAIGIGVLDCHRSRKGPFGETAEALAVADAVTMALITLRVGLRLDPRQLDLFDLSWRTHAVVHQATGALSAQLGVSTADALARLRAHAFLHSRPLEAVARDVLDGGLRIG
jgi:GAF domain/ANTAR domain